MPLDFVANLKLPYKIVTPFLLYMDLIIQKKISTKSFNLGGILTEAFLHL